MILFLKVLTEMLRMRAGSGQSEKPEAIVQVCKGRRQSKYKNTAQYYKLKSHQGRGPYLTILKNPLNISWIYIRIWISPKIESLFLGPRSILTMIFNKTKGIDRIGFKFIQKNKKQFK